MLFLKWSCGTDISYNEAEYVFAYIDPGAGSYFFQLLIATVVGSLYALRVGWYRIKLFVSQIFYRRSSSVNLLEKASSENQSTPRNEVVSQKESVSEEKGVF